MYVKEKILENSVLSAVSGIPWVSWNICPADKRDYLLHLRFDLSNFYIIPKNIPRYFIALTSTDTYKYYLNYIAVGTKLYLYSS